MSAPGVEFRGEESHAVPRGARIGNPQTRHAEGRGRPARKPEERRPLARSVYCAGSVQEPEPKPAEPEQLPSPGKPQVHWLLLVFFGWSFRLIYVS